MLKMLVVLVIVVRPHTGTLRGLRRRLFSRLVTDPRSGADPAVATRARNTYDSDHHTGVRGPLDPQKIFACGGRYLLKNTSVSCTLWEPDPESFDDMERGAGPLLGAAGIGERRIGIIDVTARRRRGRAKGASARSNRRRFKLVCVSGGRTPSSPHTRRQDERGRLVGPIQPDPLAPSEPDPAST